MRIPTAEHQAHPWVMATIAPDFTLLDAWDLPVRGASEDFGAFVDLMWSLDPARVDSAAVRFLFRVRTALGVLLRLDDAQDLSVPGTTEATLATRLPAELQGSAVRAGDHVSEGAAEFVPLYRTESEAAAEISNRTVHGVLQLGWVAQADGRYQGRLGVYVKPRGHLGTTYLRLIAPFRHLVVYPELLRHIERRWVSADRPPGSGSSGQELGELT